MEANPAPLRSHPAVIASIVLAAVAVTACAVVGIAYMLGWVGKGVVPPTPGSIATPGQQLAGTAPDMGLLPGETLVTMPEPPKSAIPPPAPRPLVPIPEPTPPAKPAPVRPAYEERSETTRARIVPDRDTLCVNCGIVASIVPRGDFWDVLVRYDDGSTQTLRYPERPRLRPGERVHFEDGRLLSDRGR
ncbi:MAG TPA: hypothetical protein VN598_01175 [Usitatibacter sp.]|nr:hypothetical protein [Usitatibacter sp.]